MKIERLSKLDTISAFNSWEAKMNDENFMPSPDLLDNDYVKLREVICGFYNDAKNEIREPKRERYLIDCKVGISLYKYLKTKNWFSVRLAGDNDFWRYLCVKVVPDLVYKRWSLEIKYYTQPNRIWLKTLWWYIHLTLQKNEAGEEDYEKTYSLISRNGFTTDTIQGMVDRSGKNGIFTDVYRTIAKYIGQLKLANTETITRGVLKLNTARNEVIDPNLYKGGVDGYVKSLFSYMGIENLN